MSILRNKKETTAEDFAPWAGGEDGLAYLGEVLMSEGMSRRAMYNLEILTIIINEQNEKVFKRIPPEVFGGLSEGGRRNVQGALVARAYEAAVRQHRKGLEAEVAPFLDWDASEQAIRAWATADNCWSDDVIGDAIRRWGPEIAHGNEARVFRLDGNHVAKVISIMFDPQEGLDRITLHNALFPETNLKVLGYGKNEDGCLCVIVKQPFVKGESCNAGGKDSTEITLPALDTFECLDPAGDNSEYATPHILVGDLHDRNIIREKGGRNIVIDCNLWLNTPERNKKGQWVIPTVDASFEGMKAIHHALNSIMPVSRDMEKMLEIIDAYNPGNFLRYSNNHFDGIKGAVTLPLKDGRTGQFLVGNDPENPRNILLNSTANVSRLIKYDKRFSETEKKQLAMGDDLRKGEAIYRFDLNRGRVVKLSGKKLKKEMTYGPRV